MIRELKEEIARLKAGGAAVSTQPAATDGGAEPVAVSGGGGSDPAADEALRKQMAD